MRKIKRIAVFDFDGTLVDTPLPENGKVEYLSVKGVDWPHKGWWGRAESLDVDVFKMPLIEHVIADYKEEYANEDTLVVLLTGRLQKLSKSVKKVLESKGLVFHEYYFNNSGKPTIEAKIDTLNHLLTEYPEIDSIALWDDRVEHLETFLQWGSKLDIDFSFTQVAGNHHGPQ